MKRGYLMSYVRKAKKGYYSVAVYRDENGKRRQKSAGCFSLKREAVSAAVTLEKNLNAINQPLKDISLADYYQRWYETYKQNGLSGITPQGGFSWQGRSRRINCWWRWFSCRIAWQEHETDGLCMYGLREII